MAPRDVGIWELDTLIEEGFKIYEQVLAIPELQEDDSDSEIDLEAHEILSQEDGVALEDPFGSFELVIGNFADHW